MENKNLKTMIGKRGGRDSNGHVSVRQRGGGSKKYLRKIDFKRDKIDIPGVVEKIEYDPNRNVDIALVLYPDGERRYIIAPLNLEAGDKVVSGESVEIKAGNATSLRNIPVGTPIHNLELVPGKGGQIVRGAGSLATILSKEGGLAQVKLPSGELRIFSESVKATIGQVGNISEKFKKLRKAGDSRHRGKRPHVRGVAQHPGSHPHGGGEGRSGIGMPSPKSPWGKPTLGKKTRKKAKYSDKYIITNRKSRSVARK
ncbi:50S ribosomal protein L2 [Candidatus Microgenomates bacterium]|jgi:large subunit ribosomal protein L2|nr:MAG: 50S ribosomal protein L2 [Candidatus Microgenomates bacterium]